jgi:hypothetical protein
VSPNALNFCVIDFFYIVCDLFFLYWFFSSYLFLFICFFLFFFSYLFLFFSTYILNCMLPAKLLPFNSSIVGPASTCLKGHGNEADFLGFLQKLVPHESLTLPFRAVPILASNLQRYLYSKNESPLSPIRGVADSPYRWVGESTTPRITDTWSRRLPASPIRRVGYWIF